MLKPTVWELLEGVAASLADTVLPELAPGPARLQVQAAIAITRRVARSLPSLGPNLQAQAAEIAAALPAVWAASGSGPSPAARETVAQAAQWGATPVPGLGELYRVVSMAGEAVAEAVAAAEPAAAPEPLLELLAALCDHADALGLSPW